MKRFAPWLAIAVSLSSALLAATLSCAEEFPTKPVRIVVGYPPGGSADFVARVLSEDLGRELGKPIVIDNRPGAGTNIASELVAQAAPDGHTLLLGSNGSHGINKALYKKLNFDPDKDFVPITKVSSSALIIAVNPSLGVNSLQELIAKAKTQPGRLNFASSGNGSPPHLAGVLFNMLAGVDLVHIPFRGGAPAVVSTLAGDTQLIFGTPPVVLPHIEAGKLKALATTTRARSPVIPSMPSAAEAGLRDYDLVFWFGLFTPKGTPSAVVKKIFEATVKALRKPAIRARFAQEGVEAQPSASPEAFQAFIKQDTPFWEKLVAASGATVD